MWPIWIVPAYNAHNVTNKEWILLTSFSNEMLNGILATFSVIITLKTRAFKALKKFMKFLHISCSRCHRFKKKKTKIFPHNSPNRRRAHVTGEIG